MSVRANNINFQIPGGKRRISHKKRAFSGKREGKGEEEGSLKGN
jgi:hypothetical protein